MPTHPPVSILVPAYNEQEAIREVVTGLRERYPDYEIVVVDDGSKDETYARIEDLPVRVIRHPRNRGYGGTWKTLAQAATGDIIVFYDGDGQFDPEYVQRLVDRMVDTNADMVSGLRGRDSHASLRRQPGKKVLSFVANTLAGQKIPDLNCGLRAFRRQMFLKFLPLLPNTFSASTTSMMLFLMQGLSVEFVPITVVERQGTSSVKIFRDGFNTIMLIIRIVALCNPLRLFLSAAFFLTAVSLVYSLYHAISYGLGVPMLGAVGLLAGVMAFFFGVVCDQISALRLQHLQYVYDAGRFDGQPRGVLESARSKAMARKD